MKLYMYPYKMSSGSCKALASKLNATRITGVGKYVPTASHLVINWGNATPPNFEYTGHWPKYFINVATAVALAVNKLHSFNRLSEKGIPTPAFTTNKEDARLWLEEGRQVLARTALCSHSGNGIIFPLNIEEPIPEAKLYVQYIKKQHEYRVHVFNGKVIDVQQKRRKTGEETNSWIRNAANGWVFCRNDIDIPNNAVLANSIAAVGALGLVFGAVDVIWNNHYKQAYVLEVNTAPGLEGATVDIYANAIKSFAAALEA